MPNLCFSINMVWFPVIPQDCYNMHVLTALIIEHFSCPLLTDAIKRQSQLNVMYVQQMCSLLAVFNCIGYVFCGTLVLNKI